MNLKKSLYMLSIFSTIFLMNCAKVETLNLKTHIFNKIPENVIWLQIAGLNEEHLAMLRFYSKNENQKSSFESAQCIGKAWSYNLYELRPSSRESFQSQLSSSKNILGKCEDLAAKPFWNKIKDETYSLGVFESGANKSQSFENYQKCQSNEFSKDFIFWSMTKPLNKKNALKFTEKEYHKGSNYYDPSCRGSGICFNNIQNNIKNIWSKFEKVKGRKIFIIRDYSYENSLRKGKILEARETLSELEKVHRYFKDLLKKKKNLLILVSSGGSRNFEFPTKGINWAKFEKTGKKIIYRSSSLLSPVLAEGNSSENFCGLYSESEIGQRIFWSPRTKKLKILNF